MAAMLLDRGLQDLGIDVESAGTIADNGRSVTPEITALLAEQGVTDIRHSSRFLTERILTETDLVLAMAREHQQAVIRLMPSMAKRTFTLIEFPLLGDKAGSLATRRAAQEPRTHEHTSASARIRALAKSVARQAGRQDPGVAVDIVDPYRRDETVYREMAGQLVPAVDKTIAILREALSS